jgi:AcrR family transcriptional regulator
MNGSMSFPAATAPVSHNQIGQKLGRKGQETRERILSAMLRLLADQDGPPVTLTSVAKEASVRLTNLYLYFPDVGDLLLAALSRVMATAEAGFVEKLRERWPDEALYDACLAFLKAHYEFWKKNARTLHMRNAMADANDQRILEYRNLATRPLIDLLAAQMDCPPGQQHESCAHVATVMLTGLERVATVLTNPQLAFMIGKEEGADRGEYVQGLIEAQAEVMVHAIAHRRALSR